MVSQNTVKYVVIGVVSLIVFGLITGCDWGDVVKAKTPQSVADSQNIGVVLRLNDAVFAYEDYKVKVTREIEQWGNEIEQKSQIVAFLNGLTMQVMDEIGPQVAGIPVLAALFPTITGLLGLMMKRPGDVAGKDVETLKVQSQAEKDKLYDEGFAAGKATVLEGLRATK